MRVSSSCTDGVLSVRTQSSRARSHVHCGKVEGRLRPGVLIDLVSMLTLAACGGHGVEDVTFATWYVACIAELVAPGVGIILTDTSTGVCCAVQCFFVARKSYFCTFG